MRVQYGLSAFERARGDLPQLPVVNLFAEEAPSEQTGVVLQSRPGLSDREADMGTSIEVLFSRDGVVFGGLFGVSGGSFYDGTDLIGSVTGSGAVSMAGNETGLFTTAGQTLYFYNGATLAAVAFPDGADVTKVFAGASRVFAIRADTGKVYWTDPLASDIDALDFATAESAADSQLDGLWIDDKAVLFGSETVEVWASTTDDDLPITPIESLLYEKGIRATGCAAVFDYGFAFVGNDHAVYIGSAQKPVPISNPGLEEKIAASAACRLFTFPIDGQEFLALRLDASTYVYGARNRLWSEFASYGEDNWLPQCHAAGVFGCADGRTAEWGSGHLDFAGVLERRFRAGFVVNAGGLFVDNLILRANVGQTPYLTGDYLDPTVELAISDDAGQTFGAWDGVSLGAQGNYRQRVAWHCLGLASQPGFLAEFRVTAPVPFRVSDVLVNEKFGGR